MRKLIAIAAVTLTLAACHGDSTTEVAPTTTDTTKVDSCKVKCDSTKVVDTAKAAK